MLLVRYLQFKVKIDSTALYLSEHIHPPSITSEEFCIAIFFTWTEKKENRKVFPSLTR